MNQNVKIARQLVKIARMLVAFKGAQKIIDAIVAVTGLDIGTDDGFQKIDEAKNTAIKAMTDAATVDGKVRDMYLDWLRDRACSGEIDQFLNIYPKKLNASVRNAMFFNRNTGADNEVHIFLNDGNVQKINHCISILFHGNQKYKDTIDGINGKIKSKTISIKEMKDIIDPFFNELKELSNSNKRTSLMKKFDDAGKKVYSNGSWSVVLFDDISKRQDLIDFAGHCTQWCITGKGMGGDMNFNKYSDKYYVICNGNKPICCFYNDHGTLWFEMNNAQRFNSNNDHGNGYNRVDVYDLYEKGDDTVKTLLKDIIPDFAMKMGFKLAWKL